MAVTTAVGLDIGTTAVRVAQLTFTRTGVRLDRLGSADLPEGAVVNGEILDTEVVADVLRALWRTTGLRHKKVLLGVADQRVVVRQVELPRIPAADLARALPYQVADILPIAIETAVMDFHHLQDTTGPSGEPLMKGLLVAAPRDLVMHNVRAVELAGLVVASVDLTPFAVLRATGTRLDPEVDTEAVVDIGAQVTNIVVHSAGVPRFVRIMLGGGRDVTDAVSEVLGLDHDAAEALKRESGLPGSADDTDPLDQAASAVEEGAQALVEGIRASLDHYRATVPAHPVERIVLSGGGSLLTGLAERLTEATRLPVTVGDPLAGLMSTGAPADPQGLAPVCAVTVGLALGAGR